MEKRRRGPLVWEMVGDQEKGAGVPAASAAGAPPLPCLHRDSSTEKQILSGSQWKTSWALAENVRLFVEKYGLERVGFHTETFADHVVDMKEASRRFNSLRTHVLSDRYLDYIAPEDKGARLVRYSRGARKWSCRFASLGPGATVWRRKLAAFCRVSGLNWSQLRETFGPRWAWHLAPILDCILLEVDEYGKREKG